MRTALQVSDFRKGMPVLRNQDAPLYLFHDETNNIRRLTLSEVGVNAPVNRTFATAGIALRPDQTLSGWNELRRALRIQPSAQEIKFKHVAPSDYEAALGSDKLAVLLTWLLDNELLIHYSVLDVLHWSILDIVETLMTEDRLLVSPVHLELKNELYYVVSADTTSFMSLLHSFSYPNLERARVTSFLEAVSEFVEYSAETDRNVVTTMLKQTLRHAARLPGLELPFLHDNEPGELIKDFGIHFMHIMFVFKNASHVFDREVYVEKALQAYEIQDGDRRLDYRFADSKDEIGIQVSDIVAGLIGRHFTFLQNHSMTELLEKRESFSDQQTRNLDLLRTLIDRSDEFSDGFCHAIVPLDTQFKNNSFLHGQASPSFLS